VILMVGTNGSAKTTTVAKLGRRLQREGRACCWRPGHFAPRPPNS
jgi:signal recognition particle GTPase